MNKNNNSLKALDSLERVVSTELQESFKEVYVNRYLNELDSAVSEAEMLLLDAKKMLQNQPFLTPNR